MKNQTYFQLAHSAVLSVFLYLSCRQLHRPHQYNSSSWMMESFSHFRMKLRFFSLFQNPYFLRESDISLHSLIYITNHKNKGCKNSFHKHHIFAFIYNFVFSPANPGYSPHPVILTGSLSYPNTSISLHPLVSGRFPVISTE